MKYLITGASGFVGKWLVKELAKFKNNELYLIKNKSNIVIPKEFSSKISTINYTGSYESLSEVPKNIDIVVHLATYYTKSTKSTSISDLDKIFDANVKFGIHLLEKMKSLNILNLINFTTYSENRNNPVNLYAISKKNFRTIIKYYVDNFGIKSINLELYDTYGLDDTRNKFIDIMLQAIKQNKLLKMTQGEQEVAYIHINDVIQAIIAASKRVITLNSGSNEIYSVYGLETMTLKELVELCCNVLKKSIKVDYGFYTYPKNTIMNVIPSYTILPNWYPQITLKEGIKEKWRELNQHQKTL